MWKNIEEYDKLKKKPEFCVFFVAEKKGDRPYTTLKACLSESRRMGNRVITHYMDVGEPESKESEQSD